MEALGIIIPIGLILLILAGIGSSSSNNNHAESSQSKKTPSRNSKHIVIKKNGQSKRYRINQYGELFEE